MKDDLQLLQNRAFRIISGAKYDAGPKDILKNLKLDLLDVGRKKLKSIFLCMVLNGSSAQGRRKIDNWGGGQYSYIRVLHN